MPYGKEFSNLFKTLHVNIAKLTKCDKKSIIISQANEVVRFCERLAVSLHKLSRSLQILTFLIFGLVNSELSCNKGSKGPHVVHLSTVCHLFFYGSAMTAIFGN